MHKTYEIRQTWVSEREVVELEMQVFMFCRVVDEACRVCLFNGGIGAGGSWALHRKRAPGKV